VSARQVEKVGFFPGASREQETKEQLMTRNPYRNPARYRRLLVTGALATDTMLGTAGIASAATTTSTTATSGSSSTATTPATAKSPAGTPPADAKGDAATMPHGPGLGESGLGMAAASRTDSNPNHPVTASW
jgi:hypothetical protein